MVNYQNCTFCVDFHLLSYLELNINVTKVVHLRRQSLGASGGCGRFLRNHFARVHSLRIQCQSMLPSWYIQGVMRLWHVEYSKNCSVDINLGKLDVLNFELSCDIRTYFLLRTLLGFFTFLGLFTQFGHQSIVGWITFQNFSFHS